VLEIGRRDEIRREMLEITAQKNDDQQRFSDEEIQDLAHRWLKNLTVHQKYYEFDSAQIEAMKMQLEKFENSCRESEIADEKARITQAKYEQAAENLEKGIDDYLRTTGKMPVLTSLPFKNKPKGN
jgi:hypothetical protein